MNGTLKTRMVSISVVLSMASWAQAATLEALWEFDGDYTAVSSSSHNYDGVPSPDVTFVPGKIGQAVHFDPDYGVCLPAQNCVDRVDSTDPVANVEFNGGVSIMAWIRPVDVTLPIIMHTSSHGDASRRGFGFRWRGVNEGAGFRGLRFGCADNTFVGGITASTPVNIVPEGQWTHVAVSYDGSTAGAPGSIRFYVDGVEVPSTIELSAAGFDGLVTTTPIVVRMGAHLPDSAGGIGSGNGDLDHVSLWKGPVIPQDVLDDFISTSGECPIADAGDDLGDDLTIAVGDTVYLNGSDSYDPDGDTLSFTWTFHAEPDGSNSVLVDPFTATPSFYADVVGVYTISLQVEDGSCDDFDMVDVTVISADDAAVEVLIDFIETIKGFDPSVFKNKNSANALSNKIDAVLAMIDEGLYEDALDKLQNDILKKTDGCPSEGEEGGPDNNDWLTSCEEQVIVRPLVDRAINLLMTLIE